MTEDVCGRREEKEQTLKNDATYKRHAQKKCLCLLLDG